MLPSFVCTAFKLTTAFSALYAELSIQPSSKSIDYAQDGKCLRLRARFRELTRKVRRGTAPRKPQRPEILTFLPEVCLSLLPSLAEDFPMTRSKFVLGSVLCLASFTGGVMVAQGPRHPNLMEAQRLINQAFDRIVAAQQANEWDMGGHAARAKDLLDQAKREIRLATVAANRH